MYQQKDGQMNMKIDRQRGKFYFKHINVDR
jgi:hypothetical protein